MVSKRSFGLLIFVLAVSLPLIAHAKKFKLECMSTGGPDDSKETPSEEGSCFASSEGGTAKATLHSMQGSVISTVDQTGTATSDATSGGTHKHPLKAKAGAIATIDGTAIAIAGAGGTAASIADHSSIAIVHANTTKMGSCDNKKKTPQAALADGETGDSALAKSSSAASADNGAIAGSDANRGGSASATADHDGFATAFADTNGKANANSDGADQPNHGEACAEAKKGGASDAVAIVDCNAISKAEGSGTSANATCAMGGGMVKAEARNGGHANGSDFGPPSCDKGKMPGGFAKVASGGGNCQDPK